MNVIRFRVERAHALPVEEARARLVRLVEKIAAQYARYDVRHDWTDEARTAIRFRFAREGRGAGEGTARLVEGLVEVEVDARFHLPFFVPVSVAEWKARDEVAQALREAFG